jgi:hypothetical protein
MHIGRWLVLASGVLAMACTQVALVPGPGLTPSPAATTAPADGFRCPASGTTLTTTTGNTSIFYGAAPNDPEACMVQFARVPEPRPNLFSLLGTSSPEAEKFRQAMRQIAPFDRPASARYLAVRLESQSQWTYTISALGRQTISVPAGQFDVYVIAMDEEGFAGNYYKGRRVWYFDVKTWIPVRFVQTVERGSGSSGGWEARQISRSPV